MRTRQTFQHPFGSHDSGSDAATDSDRVVFSARILPDGITETTKGLLVGGIRASRKARALDHERERNVWRDGCAPGE